MRFVLFVALGLSVALVSGALAQDKEVNLKGNITCAKCELKVKDLNKCATVIVVKDGDKDVVYYFDAKSDKANHRTICQGGKKGSVTGTVSEKDGKKTVTVTKVAFD